MVSNVNRVQAGVLLHVDAGVEVAPALQVVEQIALALIQEIVVESILLIDRYLPFQNAAADAKALRSDEDDRSRLDQIRVIDGIRFGPVLLFCDQHLRQHALLLLKLLAQVLKRIGDTYSRNALAGVHPGDVLQLFLGES